MALLVVVVVALCCRKRTPSKATSKAIYSTGSLEQAVPLTMVEDSSRKLSLSTATERVRALYDYEAEAQSKEIGFKQGEEFDVLNKTSTGWWFVKGHGRTGWVPENYMHILSATDAIMESPRAHSSDFSEPAYSVVHWQKAGPLNSLVTIRSTSAAR